MSLALISSESTSFAGTKVSLGRKVSKSQWVSMDKIDHASWDALLKRYVDTNGNVDYAKWQKSSTDVKALDDYLSKLSEASRSIAANNSAKLAFWINAYNAVTIRGILREYPTSSIRNHTAKFYGYNIWHDLLLRVGGDSFSLDQMEHEILRKLGEPKIHFAIVCASRSCPRLLNQAYTAEKIKNQLTLNTQVFFRQRGNYRYDISNSKMQLSSILKWFGDDFGNGTRAQVRAIAPYFPSRQDYEAAVKKTPQVSYLSYDWDLNDQATTPAVRR